MNNADLASRLSYAARLADYLLCQPVRNRVLQCVPLPLTNGTLGPVNPNRVAILGGIDFSTVGSTIPTGGALVQLSIGYAPVLAGPWVLLAKEADVAAVTPSPFVLRDLCVDILTWGPVITGQPGLTAVNLGSAKPVFQELVLTAPDEIVPGGRVVTADLRDALIPPSGGFARQQVHRGVRGG